MSFGTRASAFLSSINRQACFNIGMSFLAFSFAGQVYQAKLNRLGLEEQISRMTNALVKIDSVVLDESQSDKELRLSLRSLVAEARGESLKLTPEEAAREFAVEESASGKKGNVVI